ncbi:MAG: N-6 DNA methylase [archaeon]
MLNAELKSDLDKLWKRFWAGGLANPLTAIEQISNLIFIKRLEDLDNQNIKRAEAKKEKYKSIFSGTFEVSGKKIDKATCKWSHWKHFTAEQMLVHVRDVVFPFMKQADHLEIMEDAIFMIPKASLLQEAVSIIDNLKIAPQNYDVLGDLYEYLLSELSSAGKVGQFRTPRHIIRMMIELLEPKIGDKICDPACGTAGFLVNAFEYIKKSNTSTELIQYDEAGIAHNLIGDKITKKEHWKILNTETLYGYDFDSTMARIATMNLLLHGIDKPNIKRFDTLSKAFEQKSHYDIILANPPFTGSLDESDIHSAFKADTTKTELLFIELFYNLLTIGGRAAVIVPNGVLFGSSNAHKKIRQLLLEKCQLEAVISMPSGVFRPYAGVGTAVLVFIKSSDKTESVWFYDMVSDGFSLDDKRDPIGDGKGDIPDIVEKYRTKAISEKSILVPIDKIKSNDFNLSISAYRETKQEHIEYEQPKKIIEKVLKMEKEIQEELEELKKMV